MTSTMPDFHQHLSDEEKEALGNTTMGPRGHATTLTEQWTVVEAIPDERVRAAEQELDGVVGYLGGRCYPMGDPELTRGTIERMREFLDYAEEYLDGAREPYRPPTTEKEIWLHKHWYLNGEKAGEIAWRAYLQWRDNEQD